MSCERARYVIHPKDCRRHRRPVPPLPCHLGSCAAAARPGAQRPELHRRWRPGHPGAAGGLPRCAPGTVRDRDGCGDLPGPQTSERRGGPGIRGTAHPGSRRHRDRSRGAAGRGDAADRAGGNGRRGGDPARGRPGGAAQRDVPARPRPGPGHEHGPAGLAAVPLRTRAPVHPGPGTDRGTTGVPGGCYPAARGHRAVLLLGHHHRYARLRLRTVPGVLPDFQGLPPAGPGPTRPGTGTGHGHGPRRGPSPCSRNRCGRPQRRASIRRRHFPRSRCPPECSNPSRPAPRAPHRTSRSSQPICWSSPRHPRRPTWPSPTASQTPPRRP